MKANGQRMTAGHREKHHLTNQPNQPIDQRTTPGEINMKPVAMIVTIFLFLVSTLHVIRLAFGIEVIVGGAVIPIWISLFGSLFPAALGLLLWREGTKEHAE